MSCWRAPNGRSAIRGCRRIDDGSRSMHRVRANRPACASLRSANSRFQSQSGWWWIAPRAIPSGLRTDGFLYYTPTGTNPLVRSAVRARHFASASGLVEGEPIAVYASTEMLMPAYLPGTAPIATPDQIILVLGDFRGDVWLMELD